MNKSKHHNIIENLKLLALLLFSTAALAETNLNFQGQLSQAGQPANGQYDMIFIVYDALTGGNQQATPITQTNVEVTAGIFNVLLDFGDAAFNNDPRWLEIFVREVGGGNYTELTPRQRIGAVPFAIEALYLGPNAVDTVALQNGAVTRAKIGNDAIGTTQIENNTITSSDIRDATITAVDISGGVLLTDKTDLYEVRSTSGTVSTLPRLRTVSCVDENDLAVWGGCDAAISGTGLVFNQMFEFWNSNSSAASLTCTALNIEPSNPADFEAVIWCIDKP